MKKIAIIGASYLQLPLVLKAKEMGVETHCFAWEDGAVCREISDYFYPISVLDKEAIYLKCAELGIDGITTIATDMAVPTICYTSEKLNLIGNSYQSSLNCTNKGLMRKTFSDHNILSPKYVEVDSYNKAALEALIFPLIVKPVDRSGSRGVVKVNNTEELEKAIHHACKESFSGKCVVEDFIEGMEVSVETISWQGEHTIIVITDKITTGAPSFVELAHHQPSLLPKNIQDEIRRNTLAALAALKIKNGASHSEFKITDDGKIYIIEVGARMGGDFIGSHLVELSTGFDFLKSVIDIALGTFVAPGSIAPVSFSGVYFLSKETESLLPYFQNSNDFDVQKDINSTDLKFITNSNDRCGYLIYKSDKKAELL